MRSLLLKRAYERGQRKRVGEAAVHRYEGRGSPHQCTAATDFFFIT